MTLAFPSFQPKIRPSVARADRGSISAGLPLIEIAALCGGVVILAALGLIAVAQVTGGFETRMVLLAYLFG
jgi:hypothetical protein